MWRADDAETQSFELARGVVDHHDERLEPPVLSVLSREPLDAVVALSDRLGDHASARLPVDEVAAEFAGRQPMGRLGRPDEIAAMAVNSPAAEAVLVLDCCHSGAASPVTRGALEAVAAGVHGVFGRDVLAACAAHQQGWEARNEDGRILGAFSYHVLQGLEGAARRVGSNKVRGSVLGEYVTDVFQAWNQDPVIRLHEAGSRPCVIAYFDEAPNDLAPAATAAPTPTLVLGTPFKPSQMFVGRAAELDWLRSTLLSGGKPVAISATIEGLGGIGKTELVIQLLHDSAIHDAFDTILWLDGAGPLPPQWEKIAISLGLEVDRVPADLLPQRVALELRRRGQSLIVLDNASEWEPVSHLVPHDFPLLVTTRTGGFGGSSFRHFELGVLPSDSATALLVEIAPALEADPGLPDLVKSLDGHALALELAGWNIKHLGISADRYIARLNQHKQDLERAVFATKYGKTVDGSLALTWNALSSEASRILWRRASLFAPTSAHRDLLRVSYVGDAETRAELEYRLERGYVEGEEIPLGDPDSFDDAYAELRALHVLARVEGYNGERWAMHRLVRDFGRKRVRPIEVESHVFALSEWLRSPSLPLAPEAPHFVVAILEGARQGGRLLSRGGRSRAIHAEVAYRSNIFFDSDYFISFLRDELRDPKAFALILGALGDINDDVRVQAVRLLETVGPMPEVLEAFVEALNDPEAEVRERAIASLAKYGEERTINLLRATLAGEKATARLAAARALRGMEERGRVALGEALTSEDSAVRLEAALGLSEQGQAEGMPVLLEALERTRGAYQRQVISALASARDQRAVPVLERLLLEGGTADNAARALLAITGESALPALVSAAERGSRETVRSVTRILSEHGQFDAADRVVESLVRLLKANPVEYGFSSVLFRIASNNGISLPVDLLTLILQKSSDWSDRQEAVKLLGESRERAAVPALLRSLKDSDYDVRRQTCIALGQIPDSRARKPLEAVVSRDPNSGVKEAAAAALALLGSVRSN